MHTHTPAKEIKPDHIRDDMSNFNMTESSSYHGMESSTFEVV